MELWTEDVERDLNRLNFRATIFTVFGFDLNKKIAVEKGSVHNWLLMAVDFFFLRVNCEGIVVSWSVFLSKPIVDFIPDLLFRQLTQR
jgi:hypothetical protein